MKRLIKFNTSNGSGDVIIEVDDGTEEDTGRERVSTKGGLIVEQATVSFEAAMSNLKPMVDSLWKTVESLAVKPSELSIKFGIKFTGSAGAIIASTSLEGTCEVTAKWASAFDPKQSIAKTDLMSQKGESELTEADSAGPQRA